jgi:hypothetical protein
MYYLIKIDFVTKLKITKQVFKVIEESENSFANLALFGDHCEYNSESDKVKQFSITKHVIFKSGIKEAVNKYLVKKRLNKLNRI